MLEAALSANENRMYSALRRNVSTETWRNIVEILIRHGAPLCLDGKQAGPFGVFPGMKGRAGVQRAEEEKIRKLFEAVDAHDIAAVKEALEEGADPCFTPGSQPCDAATLAVIRNHADIVELMLPFVERDRESLMESAIHAGHEPLVAMIVKQYPEAIERAL